MENYPVLIPPNKKKHCLIISPIDVGQRIGNQNQNKKKKYNFILTKNQNNVRIGFKKKKEEIWTTLYGQISMRR